MTKPVDARAHFAATMSEKTLSQRVVELARARGWKVARWPTWRATGTDPGVPDLLLAREMRVIFAELKIAKGKLSPAQEEWRYAIEPAFGDTNVEYFLWRPMELLDGTIDGGLA